MYAKNLDTLLSYALCTYEGEYLESRLEDNIWMNIYILHNLT
jgi:hypothetical protein